MGANPSGPATRDTALTALDHTESGLLLAICWREIPCPGFFGTLLGTNWHAVTQHHKAADGVAPGALTDLVFNSECFTILPEQGWQPAPQLLAGRETLLGLASSEQPPGAGDALNALYAEWLAFALGWQ